MIFSFYLTQLINGLIHKGRTAFKGGGPKISDKTILMYEQGEEGVKNPNFSRSFFENDPNCNKIKKRFYCTHIFFYSIGLCKIQWFTFAKFLSFVLWEWVYNSFNAFYSYILITFIEIFLLLLSGSIHLGIVYFCKTKEYFCS